MKLLIRPKALKSLEKIAFYVESINTKGSGDQFLVKFLNSMQQYALEGVTFQSCKHFSLSSKGYSCVFHEQWVIAFKIQGNQFIIYRIVWGPSLF